jgi:hypothetical protein
VNGIKWHGTGVKDISIGKDTEIDFVWADVALWEQDAVISLYFGTDDGVTLADLKAAIDMVFAKAQKRAERKARRAAAKVEKEGAA